jgi:hypothetical protein
VARVGPGDRVAERYVLLEQIGAGGMGVVYRARDERDGREVALKVLGDAVKGEAAVRRLQREARATRSLDPKHVAAVFDVGETAEGQLYLAMEYVRGRTVRALLKKGRVARAEALRIVREVASALGEAHHAGVVHRDVKPDNIMVGDDGRVVLVDFGIVKNLETGDDAAHLSTQLTNEGAVLGTPAYLAPEQALSREVGPPADQFALAVTSYELLTGKLPWTATDMTRVLAQVLAETPPPASTIDRMLPPGLDDVLWRGLAKAPGDRYPSVAAFAEALDAAERGQLVPSPARTLASPRGAATPRDVPDVRSRRRWVAALVALPLLGALFGLAAKGREGARGDAARPKPTAAAIAASALARPEAHLACPIFAVSGVNDVAGPLGAGAAALACSRAKWYLGGRDDRVLYPANLLDAPTQPSAVAQDLYADPAQRAHTIALAQARSEVYLDGTIVYDGGSWRAEIVARAADQLEIARSEGRDDAALARAIKQAIETLWGRPVFPRMTIDPEVSRWTAFPDIETGFIDADLSESIATAETCATVRRRAGALGNAFYLLESSCAQGLAPRAGDAGFPTIDESSAPALATSVIASVAMGVDLPSAEVRRLGAELDDLREKESSRFGAAMLGNAAGGLWARANEPDHAYASLLVAVRQDPHLLEAWQQLAWVAAESGASSPASGVAAAWFPSDPTFLQKAFSTRSDELDARLRDAHLAFLLEHSLARAVYLGRALAEAGRGEEARAISTLPMNGEASPNLESYILGLIDLHDARLERALEHLQHTVDIGLFDIVTLATILDRLGPVATGRTTQFLGLGEDAFRGTVLYAGDAVIALCMHARRDLATRCMNRIGSLGTSTFWGTGGGEFFRGAQAFSAGDRKGAVSIWRPLVGGPNWDIVRVLPTEAFEREGEPALAARLDGRKMSFTNTAGVSEAAPREAKRAKARGDNARARELARKVVEAWEVADTKVSAVAEMRTLLRSLE